MERKKANVHDLYALDIPYFCFEPVINRVKNIKGTRYLLSKPLTETQKESIGKFKNVNTNAPLIASLVDI